MMKELDNIAIAVDLPEHRLKKGDIGIAALVHGTRGYEVAFTTLDGETLTVVSLSHD